MRTFYNFFKILSYNNKVAKHKLNHTTQTILTVQPDRPVGFAAGVLRNAPVDAVIAVLHLGDVQPHDGLVRGRPRNGLGSGNEARMMVVSHHGGRISLFVCLAGVY